MEKKNNQEPISIEEYLIKRQKIKDEEERKKKKDQEKAQIWMLADLWCQTSIASC